MAGSYNHATTNDGRLRSPETMSNATENQGDAYETIEEMYGMIWWLANQAIPYVANKRVPHILEKDLVELARKNWKQGILLHSPGREVWGKR